MEEKLEKTVEEPVAEDLVVTDESLSEKEGKKKKKKKKKEPRRPLNKKRVLTFLCVVGCTFALVALIGYIFVQKLVREEDSADDYDFKEVKLATPIINEQVGEEDDNWFMNALDETAKPVTQKTEEAEAAAKKVETQPKPKTATPAATAPSTAPTATAAPSGEATDAPAAPSTAEPSSESAPAQAPAPKPETTTPPPAPKETPSTPAVPAPKPAPAPKEAAPKAGE